MTCLLLSLLYPLGVVALLEVNWYVLRSIKLPEKRVVGGVGILNAWYVGIWRTPRNF